jgi:DNA adenine methylase
MIIPPIKCQGIKTKLAKWIAEQIPQDYNIWYEPFMGSGVVGFNVRPKRAVFADTNPHIIKFYNDIKNGVINAIEMRKYLTKQSSLLQNSGVDFYNEVRSRFNECPNSFDFLFLNRSCFNGIMRFNRKGGFNVPFCKKTNRFSKAYITKIVNQIDCIAQIISMNDYQFICATFEEIIIMAKDNDLIYCDPPYIDRYCDYFNGWDERNELCLNALLAKTHAKFVLSTWHHNKFRKNKYIEIYKNYSIITKEHFYHIGAREENRNSIIECLVMNYSPIIIDKFTYKKPNSTIKQISLFDTILALN